MIYVGLLRGINVGGNNKVEMKKLKTTFESLGFTNVITHINSGNIIFESNSIQQGNITAKVEKAIKNDFQLDLNVLVKDINSIVRIFENLPATWVKDKTMRTDVMFLWEKFDFPEVIEKLRTNPVDNIKYVPGALLWNVEGENYSKSGMLNLMGTDLYRNMTIRNVNTFRKIHQIMMDLNNR
ncbi:MAG TPA: DUF1697 domain-containing protein [Petrimonas sp.]|uniref:DUF1697 domain-containing protein n=1 Tax=Petrimonas sp. TaxID=2023866 RepID=UPI001779F998|nr:DUF1697 domain-containing protein [Petrimonas sp.]